MAIDVYSIAMFEQHNLTGDGAAVGPEEGFVWVVASVDVVLGNTIGSVQAIGAGGQAFFSAGTLVPVGFFYAHYGGRYVLTYPETFYITSSVAADVTACGYNLTLP